MTDWIWPADQSLLTFASGSSPFPECDCDADLSLLLLDGRSGREESKESYEDGYRPSLSTTLCPPPIPEGI